MSNLELTEVEKMKRLRERKAGELEAHRIRT